MIADAILAPRVYYRRFVRDNSRLNGMKRFEHTMSTTSYQYTHFETSTVNKLSVCWLRQELKKGRKRRQRVKGWREEEGKSLLKRTQRFYFTPM
jgi:hypothetical protein